MMRAVSGGPRVERRGEVVYLDRSLDLRRALVDYGRAREWERLAPLIGSLVGVVLALAAALFASELGWS